MRACSVRIRIFELLAGSCRSATAPQALHALPHGLRHQRIAGDFAEIESLLEPGLGKFIYGPSGCEECRRQGYRGRVGVFEIMVMNRKLRQLLLNAVPAEELQNAAIANGMIELRAAMLKQRRASPARKKCWKNCRMEYLGLDV